MENRFVRLLWCVLLVVLGWNTAFAQSSVSENEKMESRILKRTVDYAVYLPPGYAASDRSYPVLYLLHGAGGSHRDWIRNGNMKTILDKCLSDGTGTEMIVVMPDAKDSWYLNGADGSSSYEDMFFKELIPHVESTYRVVSEKGCRAVAGLSMGGYGALIYTLRHPDAFVATFAMSPAVRTDEEMLEFSTEAYLKKFGQLYGAGPDASDRLSVWWRQYDVLSLLENLTDENRKKLKIYVSCGDDDHLYRGNAALWVTLRQTKVSAEFRVENGGHNWSYWRNNLREYIPILSNMFNR